MISRQSRYIMYGSSNLTLKKNDELAAYGGRASRPSVGPDGCDERTVVRTTKPSSASPFHVPLRPTSSVNALTSCTDESSSDGVGMKPHSRANASRTAVG